MPDITIQEVQQFIESNNATPEVQAYLQGLSKPTLDGVQKFFNEDQEAKKWFTSFKDSEVSKGVESFKKNTMPQLIEDEIKKRTTVTETPEQKQLRILQEKLDGMEREKKLTEVKGKALAFATEKKIPLEIVDLLVSDDEETTLNKLSLVEGVINNQVNSLVDERFKQAGRSPNNSTGKPASTLAELQKQYDQAVKDNNLLMQISLKGKIAEAQQAAQ